MKIVAALAVVIVLVGCSTPPEPQSKAAGGPVIDPRFDSKFWSVWGDGKAEVNTYDLTIPRYNQKRKGVAVAIFVTEPFSQSARVKADPGKHDAADVLPVMKLNLVKKYQTGIYDYSDMLSSFVALAPVAGQPAGSLLKTSFSSQEWCGHVYSQMLFHPGKVCFAEHSYFDGEADQQRDLPMESGGVPEDGLLLWARGVAQPWEPASSTPILTSLATLRARHVAPLWSSTALIKDAAPQTIQVKAGKFEVDVLRAANRTFYVERNSPNRIVKWETNEGESAELRASERLKYWEMNREGGEKALPGLGLPRMAPVIH